VLLAFDIGNTNIVVGGFEGKELQFEFRLKTDAGRTIDEYGAILLTLFSERLGKKFGFRSCAVCSVVPSLTADIVRFAESKLDLKTLVIGPGTKTGLPIKISEPASVGADRVVNAVAAKELFGCPSLVIDFGTATSFDLVGPKGTFEGGVIAPGLQTSLDALVRNTAKLPKIELTWPTSLVGKSTVAAMQVGAIAGYHYLIDGLINGIIEEVGPIKHIIATGGLGAVFKEHSKLIKVYDPHLTLKGVQIVASLNEK
jgi:type III pantothenate kinase